MLHRLMSEIQPMLACECNSILCTLELMGDWAVSGMCQTILRGVGVYRSLALLP